MKINEMQGRLGALYDGIAQDLGKVEEVMQSELSGDLPYIQEISTHLVNGGGKRLRPALVLLSARLHRYDAGRAIPAAAAVEIIHTATLVHDDVIDRAGTRRGVPTVNARWGEKVSVLAGDFLYARALSILARDGDPRLVQTMADAVFEMCTGEIDQSLRTFDLLQSEEDYLLRIGRKTAVFIAGCCRLGGIIGGAREEEIEALASYGYNAGVAFQIIDDLLDFQADPGLLGKPSGGDLRSGVITLPVLHALRGSAGSRIREILGEGPPAEEEISEIRFLLEAERSFEYAFSLASEYVEKARASLRQLPTGNERAALDDLAEHLRVRRF
ncbi:MAG: polyprenyl synthetase family protein [Firmicutes bacterium]|nr:polyprenyl synthetase family protein [Bacillota bacterium]MCL5039951.1 polyprenyl synthetase family protein [Bacillota bacterium]